MTSFGTMSPKLIAKIMRMAIEPSARVAPASSHVLCELLVSCTRPLAILNMKTPGIIETTEAKPTAAKGMCQRRETGAMIKPTTRHATNAPVGALAPRTVTGCIFGPVCARGAAYVLHRFISPRGRRRRNAARLRRSVPRQCPKDLAAYKSQQVRVDPLGIGGEHSMRITGVDFYRGMF